MFANHQVPLLYCSAQSYRDSQEVSYGATKSHDGSGLLGYIPRDVSAEKCGYDIESKLPGTGKLRFIEVKGRVKDSTTVIVTKNEVLTALNKPDDFFLAIVLVDGETTTTHYVPKPFQREPDFDATSVIYNLNKLLNKGNNQFFDTAFG